MVVRNRWARELGHEQEVGSRHVLQEYVLQEYVFQNPTICEREVGSSPVIREVEFVFSGVENSYRNGRRESISSSEAMIYQCKSLRLCLMVKKDNVPRPYITKEPVKKDRRKSFNAVNSGIEPGGELKISPAQSIHYSLLYRHYTSQIHPWSREG
jgi:hypothetical protein